MSRPRSALVLAGCLLVVALLTALQAPARPGVLDVGPGPDGWAVGGNAAARVDGVRLARVLRPPGEDSRQLATGHVFVVLELSVRVTGIAQSFSTVELATADGRVYSQREDALIPAVTLTQPGYTMHGTAVFELPPDRVPGAALQITGLTGVLEVYHARLRFPDVVPAGLEVTDVARLRPATTEVTP